MLANVARRASKAHGVTLGRLEAARPRMSSSPTTRRRPLTDTVAGHFLFAMDARHVRHVIVRGRWRLRDRSVVDCDERAVRTAAIDVARELWERMQRLP